jgi:PAS domain S-box-containing protein
MIGVTSATHAYLAGRDETRHPETCADGPSIGLGGDVARCHPMNPLLDEKNRRVLVIDDLQSIHDDFRKILLARASGDDGEPLLFGLPRRTGGPRFKIDSAFQGQQGFEKVQLAIAEGRPYAVAFVDVRMPPGWDGIETAEKLWSVDPDLQIVICTAFSDYSWNEMVQRLGQSDRMLILRKPFENIEVLQMATSLTEKRYLLDQMRASRCAAPGTAANRILELENALAEIKRSVTGHEVSEADLREELAMLRLICARVPVGIWLVDAAGRCRYANEHWATMSGLSVERTLGDGWARAVHPDDLVRVARNWITNCTADGTEEFRLVRPDQSVQWVRLRCVPGRDDAGSITNRIFLFEEAAAQK